MAPNDVREGLRGRLTGHAPLGAFVESVNDTAAQPGPERSGAWRIGGAVTLRLDLGPRPW